MVRGRLSRSILDQGWSKFAEQLAYKMPDAGGKLVEVPAHYTSQTCSMCGTVDAASRTGKVFKCTACGHEADADANAALEIRARGIKILEASASEPTGSACRDGQPKKLRTARRNGAKRERCSDAPLVGSDCLANGPENGPNPGGDSGTLIMARSAMENRSQSGLQVDDIVGGVRGVSPLEFGP